MLVAIPRSPERLRPDRHPEAARAGARPRAARAWPKRASSRPPTLAEARAEPVPRVRLAMPFQAPHLARALRDEDPAALDPAHDDRPAAAAAGRGAVAAAKSPALDPEATLAAMVVDNRNRASARLCRQRRFRLPSARRGTLDMARAVRSPGSALKPFIYAMAFDRLILHPETMLEDRPRHFGDYAPTDFDGRFQGEVSAREALQYSLNVPAVAVLDRLGPARFTAALAAAGVRLAPARADRRPGSGDGARRRRDHADRSGTALCGAVEWRGGGARCAIAARRSARRAARRSSVRSAAWYVNDILAEAPPPPGMSAGRGPPRPAAGLQDRHLLRFPRCLGGRLRPRGDDRGLGRAARRHPDAGPQRPADGSAGPVQDRRPSRPGNRRGARRRRLGSAAGRPQ